MVSMKYQGKWAFVASSTDRTNVATLSTAAFTNALQLPVLTDGVKKVGPVVDPMYTMGIQELVIDRGRIPTENYTGTIELEATPECLEFFTPMLTGDATTPWTLADTMTKQFDMIRSDGADTWTYRNCLVTKWSLMGASGMICKLSLEIVASNEDQTVTFASAAFTTTAAADTYLAAEASLSLAGSSLVCDDFMLTVDRMVTVKNRFNLGPTSFLPGRRMVMFKSTTVWDATAAAAYYAQGKTGVTGAVITLTKAAMNFVATTSALVVNDIAPSTGGAMGELLYGFEGVAKGSLPISTMTNELSITQDATP